MRMYCPKCKYDRSTEVKAKGPHLGAYCSVCGKWLCWVEQPMSYDRACNMKMPFGRYKDEFVSDLPIDYLEWIAREWDNCKIKKAAKVIIQGAS